MNRVLFKVSAAILSASLTMAEPARAFSLSAAAQPVASRKMTLEFQMQALSPVFAAVRPGGSMNQAWLRTLQALREFLREFSVSPSHPQWAWAALHNSGRFSPELDGHWVPLERLGLFGRAVQMWDQSRQLIRRLLFKNSQGEGEDTLAGSSRNPGSAPNIDRPETPRAESSVPIQPAEDLPPPVDWLAVAHLFPANDFLAYLSRHFIASSHLFELNEDTRAQYDALLLVDVFVRGMKTVQFFREIGNQSPGDIRTYYGTLVSMIKQNLPIARALCGRVPENEKARGQWLLGIDDAQSFAEGMSILLGEPDAAPLSVNEMVEKLEKLVFSEYYRREYMTATFNHSFGSDLPKITAGQDRVGHMLVWALAPFLTELIRERARVQSESPIGTVANMSLQLKILTQQTPDGVLIRLESPDSWVSVPTEKINIDISPTAAREGLGFPLVAKLASGLGGQARVLTSADGRNTGFEIALPKASASGSHPGRGPGLPALDRPSNSAGMQGEKDKINEPDTIEAPSAIPWRTFDDIRRPSVDPIWGKNLTTDSLPALFALYNEEISMFKASPEKYPQGKSKLIDTPFRMFFARSLLNAARGNSSRFGHLDLDALAQVPSQGYMTNPAMQRYADSLHDRLIARDPEAQTVISELLDFQTMAAFAKAAAELYGYRVGKQCQWDMSQAFLFPALSFSTYKAYDPDWIAARARLYDEFQHAHELIQMIGSMWAAVDENRSESAALYLRLLEVEYPYYFRLLVSQLRALAAEGNTVADEVLTCKRRPPGDLELKLKGRLESLNLEPLLEREAKRTRPSHPPKDKLVLPIWRPLLAIGIAGVGWLTGRGWTWRAAYSRAGRWLDKWWAADFIIPALELVFLPGLATWFLPSLGLGHAAALGGLLFAVGHIFNNARDRKITGWERAARFVVHWVAASLIGYFALASAPDLLIHLQMEGLGGILNLPSGGLRDLIIRALGGHVLFNVLMDLLRRSSWRLSLAGPWNPALLSSLRHVLASA
jgi:hypothetical protein